MIKFEFSIGYVHEDADMSRLQPIMENLQIAGEIWSQYLTDEIDVTIELNVSVVHFNIPSFATARPFDGVDLENGARQPGTLYEIITGDDPNGSTADGKIKIDVDFFNSVFVNPDANALGGEVDVPASQVDAMSAWLHEIGHAVGIIGGVIGKSPLPTTLSNLNEDYVYTGPHANDLIEDEQILFTRDVNHFKNIDESILHAHAPDGVYKNISQFEIAILQDLVDQQDPTFNIARKRIGTPEDDKLFGFRAIDPDLAARLKLKEKDIPDYLKGDDVINGGAGDDEIFALSGDDIISGGDGNDMLDGGQGTDLFVFEDGFGSDVIIGFENENGFERIDLRGVSNITSFIDLITSHLSQNANGDVVIVDGSNSITLKDISIADLSANDFIF